MKLQDWLAEHPGLPATAAFDSSITDVLALMLKPPFSRNVYVVSAEKHLIGHLSLKKIAHQLFPKYQPVHTRRQIMHRVTGSTIKDLMDTEFSCAKPDEELEDIFGLLLERDIEELPVIDPKGVLLGVVKLTSVLQHLVEQENHDALCMLQR